MKNTEKVKQDLLLFVQEKAKSENKTMEVVVKELFLGTFLEEQLSSLRERAGIVGMKMQQREINVIFMREIEQLQTLCKNVPILIFKGIVNAYYLYTEPEVRIAKDIDILVEAQNCPVVEKTLMEMGYKPKGGNRPGKGLFCIGNIFTEIVKHDRSTLDGYIYNHRTFIKYINGVKVEVELHKYLFGLIRGDKISYKEIFDTCCDMQILPNLSVKTLSPENTLLCLACHMTKHISNSVRNPKLVQRGIDMKAILDIKLLIEKSNFNWSIITERAVDWGILGSLLLTIQLINYVFPETVPIEWIEKSRAVVAGLTEKKSHESLLNGLALQDIKQIFDFNFTEFFKRETIDNSERIFEIGGNRGTDNIITLKNEKIKVSIQMYWNSDSIFYDISYWVEGGELILGVNVGSNLSHLCARNLFIRVKDEKMCLSTEPINRDFVSCEDEWLKNIKCIKDSGRICLNIPWKCLNIIPVPGLRLPFGFKAILLDDLEELIDSVSIPSGNYYDCYGLSSIRLI